MFGPTEAALEPSTLSHLGFQPVQKTPTIHASSGFVWGILVVLCALLRKFSNWPHVWDITLGDETSYLGVGITNLSDLAHGLQHYEHSPLYSKFYNLIASLTGAEAPSVFMIGGLSVLLLALFGVAIGVYAGSGWLSLSIIKNIFGGIVPWGVQSSLGRLLHGDDSGGGLALSRSSLPRTSPMEWTSRSSLTRKA